MIELLFRKYSWTLYLVIQFWIALLVASTISAAAVLVVEPSAEMIAGGSQKTPQTKQKDLAPISAFLERDLFKARERLEPIKRTHFDPSECETSTLDARLVATMVDYDRNDSVAVFEEQSGVRIVAYRAGDRLLGQAEIEIIRSKEVVVRSECERVTFTFDDPVTKPASSASRQPVAQFGKSIRRISETEFSIERGEIHSALSNLEIVTRGVRIVPSFSQKRANGFRIVRTGQLLSKLGVRNGDVLQRINGYELNNVRETLAVYDKLLSESSISVDLVRRGKKTTLSYAVR